MKNNHLYKFGDFSLDLEEKTLTKRETTLSITPKVFLLLAILIENRGRIIEKDELMQKIWEDTFVEDSNLTYNIRQLRKLLEDDFNHPKFIETIPRRGYRFIGEVTEISPETQILPPLTNPNKNNFRVGLSLIFAVGMIAVASWLIAKTLNRENLASPILAQPFQTETLALTGNTSNSAISPNGKYVAYTSGNKNNFGVWIKNLETGNNVEIIKSSDDLYYGLIFSQDSEDIYVSRKKKESSAKMMLYKVSILGGTMTKIVEDVQGWVSVSPDDKQLSFVRCNRQPDDYCSLWITDNAGTNQRKLATRLYGIDIGDNEWSPDGKTIIFANGHSENAAQFYSVSEVDVETKAERDIFQNRFFHIKNLQSLNNNEQFLMTANLKTDEPSRIWLVSKKDGEITPLSKTNESYMGISLNKSGDKLIAATIERDFKLHLYETQNPNNFRVLTDAVIGNFTSDGNILFSSYTSGNGDIWSMNGEGNNLKQLTNDKNRELVAQMSHDGRYIFFSSNRSGIEHLWRMNSDGSDQRQITEKEGGYPVATDENFVYFRSALLTKLWKTPIGGGEESLVIDKKSWIFAFSNDRRKVAYLDGETTIKIFSIAENKVINSFPITVKESPAEITWTKNDSQINYILHSETNGYTLWQQDLNGGAPQKLFDLGKMEIFPNASFSFSPDGNYFTLVRGGWKQNIVLIKGLN